MSVSTPLICHECWPTQDNWYGPCKHAEEVTGRLLALVKELERERDEQKKVAADYVAMTRLLDEHPEAWKNQQWCECALCLSYR